MTYKRGFMYTGYVATATQNVKILPQFYKDILKSQNINNNFWPDRVDFKNIFTHLTLLNAVTSSGWKLLIFVKFDTKSLPSESDF